MGCPATKPGCGNDSLSSGSTGAPSAARMCAAHPAAAAKRQGGKVGSVITHDDILPSHILSSQQRKTGYTCSGSHTAANCGGCRCKWLARWQHMQLCKVTTTNICTAWGVERKHAPSASSTSSAHVLACFCVAMLLVAASHMRYSSGQQRSVHCSGSTRKHYVTGSGACHGLRFNRPADKQTMPGVQTAHKQKDQDQSGNKHT